MRYGQFNCRSSFKIVYEDFFDKGFDAVGDKFQVLGMDLVIVLCLFAGEDGVEGHLIALVNDGTGAAHHFADVEMDEAVDVFEIFIAARDDLVSGIVLGGVGPEYDNVREHGLRLKRNEEIEKRKEIERLPNEAAQVIFGLWF